MTSHVHRHDIYTLLYFNTLLIRCLQYWDVLSLCHRRHRISVSSFPTVMLSQNANYDIIPA